jgi:hypothetical protein
MTRPKPNARAIIQPQPSAFRLPLGHFETLQPPKTFDTLVVHSPLLLLKQRCNPTISIPAVLGRQLDHPPHEPRLVAWNLRLPSLG